ncbi:hypothetical protein IGS68_28290 (plasmid) [Skermanella sp. TT6]|uniref:DUF5666 domain-containing protein n=1 Tax=Skermanella cutis TaxID=2775420 RepID=A0ABX7BIF7_9PROT|nr:hypothetical protein [Skermanella sp. TT6]QQP93063.1 hypothetical protein IGS68_28290 [Skermanella sp. TT6]
MIARISITSPAIAIILALGTGALAQTMTDKDEKPVHVQGRISSIDENRITITTSHGETDLTLAPDVTFYSLSPASPDSVTTEASIAVAGPAAQEEKIMAKVVVIYPQGSSGESGTYLTWNLTPDSMMRNGVVREIHDEPGGRVVGLSYPQGGATVVIPPDATILTASQTDMEALREGAHVYVPSAERGSGGTLEAEMIAVGENGYEPKF